MRNILLYDPWPARRIQCPGARWGGVASLSNFITAPHVHKCSYIYIHNFYFFRYILRLPCTYLDVYVRVYHVKIYGHKYLSALMYRYSYTYHVLILYVSLPNCFGLASSTLGKLFTLFQCIIFRLGLASLPT